MSELMRRDAPSIQVIGVGVGRTGTLSLCKALETLGLGPCWHPLNVDSYEEKRWDGWIGLAEEDASPEKCDEVLKGYRAVVDGPAAIIASSLLKAYPQAKFILTTRDPQSWETSMKNTVFGMYEKRKLTKDPSFGIQQVVEMVAVILRNGLTITDLFPLLDGYHGGRIHDHAQEEFLKHEEHIKRIIPENQLLIYRVEEGWDPLVNFLGV
ncbi:hypothetical protein Clacol_002188 [Clathrus columnatus]|uniref:P-loop containing nucleoside triphosphate hydrolase protein n=1 Tax=Clathrus columnatus TaxID=1419009 RepID=A0AAV5A014_9AGAM|nr:hypothetical protein Clacol_002188 [Clathrus columnatus]